MRASVIFPLLVLGATATPLSTWDLLPRDGDTHEQMCAYDFGSGDAAKDESFWTLSGAESWLELFLTRHGTDDWTDNFFKEVFASGVVSNGYPNSSFSRM